MDKIELEHEKLSARIAQVQERRKSNKHYCYKCKNETQQDILFHKIEIIEPLEIVAFDELGKRTGNGWILQARVWKITECKGCERTNLNVYTRTGPTADDIPVHHYPTKDLRPFPTWVQHLNKDFAELFVEIYFSLNSGSTRLPLMGARTLLDKFIIEKIGDIGNFQMKLKKLVEEKYISESSRDLLQVALEYGNATIHRGYKATNEEINGVLDIIENVLHGEALNDKTSGLKERMPKKK